MAFAILVWVTAAAGIVVLARLRGARGLRLLAMALVTIVLLVIAWNVAVSFRIR